MERRKEVGRLDIENPKPIWDKTVYLEDGKLMKTIHDGSFSPFQPEPVKEKYLFFESAEENSGVYMYSEIDTPPTIEYSLDKTTWTRLLFDEEDGHKTDLIVLENIGDKVYFRGTNTALSTNNKYTFFVFGGKINSGGSPLSLIYGDEEGHIVPEHGLRGLFSGSYYLLNINDECLLNAPDLSGIYEIKNGGCMDMFYGCAAMVSTSDMPLLVDIGTYGCSRMYYNCSSLEYPSDMVSLTTIGESGCSFKYYGCTSLLRSCRMEAVQNIGTNGCSQMYFDDTSLESAFDFPNLSIVGDDGCYRMFSGDSSLEYPINMPSLTKIGDSAFTNMYKDSKASENLLLNSETLSFDFISLPFTTEGYNPETFSTPEQVALWMGMQIIN